MRHAFLLVSFSVLLLLGAPAASDAAATTVSGGSLKIDGLSELTKGGKLSLVGFAWEGPAKLFANNFATTALTAGRGDRNFTVASEGPATLCAGLQRLGDRTFEEGRLSFKSADGPLSAIKVTGIAFKAIDCSKTPWTAELQAATLEPAEERAKGKAKGKDRDKTRSKGKKSAQGKAATQND